MNAVPVLAWSIDGSTLWNLDLSGQLFSLRIGRSAGPQPIPGAPALCSLQCAQNGQVAAGTKQGSLLLGQLETGLSTVRLPGHVRHVSLDRLGNRFCALADDGTKLWCGCVYERCAKWTIESEHATIAPAWSSQSESGPYLAVFEKTKVTIYRNEDRAVQSRIRLGAPPGVACWSPACPLLAIGQENGEVLIVDAFSKHLTRSLICDGPIRRLFWETSGRRLLAGSQTETWVISLGGKESDIRMQKRRQMPFVMRCGAYRPASAVFAAGCEYGAVFLSRPGSIAEPKLLHRAETRIEAVTWSPSGKRLALADQSGQIRVIRVCR